MKLKINNVRAVPLLMVDEVQCALSVRTVVMVEVAVIWGVMLCDVDKFYSETVS
jgi:hypothetical protein